MGTIYFLERVTRFLTGDGLPFDDTEALFFVLLLAFAGDSVVEAFLIRLEGFFAVSLFAGDVSTTAFFPRVFFTGEALVEAFGEAADVLVALFAAARFLGAGLATSFTGDS